jgi:DNA-directed RNA polymerase subunit N (RpoN/RPB10)
MEDLISEMLLPICCRSCGDFIQQKAKLFYECTFETPDKNKEYILNDLCITNDCCRISIKVFNRNQTSLIDSTR